MTCPTLRAPQVKRMCTKENQHSPIALVRSHWHSDKASSFSLVRVDGLFFFFFLFFILKHRKEHNRLRTFLWPPWVGGEVGVAVSFLRRG